MTKDKQKTKIFANKGPPIDSFNTINALENNICLSLIFKEFDVILREKYCQNLAEHPWFTRNENTKFQSNEFVELLLGNIFWFFIFL